MNRLLWLLLLLMVGVGCDNDDDGNIIIQTLKLEINGLDNLGKDFVYEAWLLTDGETFSIGTFSVNDNHQLSKTSFQLQASLLESATDFMITIEPKQDANVDPSDQRLLKGKFQNGVANLDTDVIADFSAISGKYQIRVHTVSNDANLLELQSGIWFMQGGYGPVSPLTAGLELPTLSKGWIYEGWVVIDGVPVSTGQFLKTDEKDLQNHYGITGIGFDFPGQDFFFDAPSGLEFPVSMYGKTAVISVEPYPDPDPKPFTLKPLLGDIADDDTGNGDLNNNVANSFPKGKVSF
ncbi:MAG: anti-sigma factor [Flavobacteriaceae bacterium]|nr:anti-sigma factor [Flavobacteriaceae bacterium]